MRNISGPDGILVLLAASGRKYFVWTKFQGVAEGGISHEDTREPITGSWPVMRSDRHKVVCLERLSRDCSLLIKKSPVVGGFSKHFGGLFSVSQKVS
jgi:hypothetical protein